MKKVYPILVVFFIFFNNYSFAQNNPTAPSNADLNKAVAPDVLNMLINDYSLKQHDVNDLKFYDKIKGNPYLPKDFTEGYITINKNKISTKFRYNMHTDEVEFYLKEKILVLTNTPEETKLVFGDNILYYLTYYPKNSEPKTGYLCLLVDGKYKLLAKKNVDFIPKDPPQPIADSKPDRFVQRDDNFYVQLENAKPIEIANKKDILDAIPELKEKIENYFSTNKVKFRNTEDIIELFKYINLAN